MYSSCILRYLKLFFFPFAKGGSGARDASVVVFGHFHCTLLDYCFPNETNKARKAVDNHRKSIDLGKLK